MICPKCKNEIPDKSINCPLCHHPLNKHKKIRVNQNSIENNFKNLPLPNESEKIKISKIENSTANILSSIGIIIIVIGILVGFISLMIIENFLIFILTVIFAIISGVLFIGFAEVIRLLQQILNNLTKQ